MIETIRLSTSSSLNPSKNEKIRKNQATKAIAGIIRAIEIALVIELNFLAYLIAKQVVAIDITEKTIPIINAAICESVIYSNIFSSI